MLNLLRNELISIEKERTISDYKSMSKNELIDAINILKPTKYNKINIFKSKRKEIKEILYEPIINRGAKIEKIKKILFDPRNDLFKPEEDHYKPVRIGKGFSSNYIQYKSYGDKDKILSIKDLSR